MLNLKRIQELLKKSQYRSEADFAEKIGISYQGWLKIKNRGKTTNRRVLQIAGALGVEVGEVLTEQYYNVYKETLEAEQPLGISNRLRELME